MAHPGWPEAAQVCRIERTRQQAGKAGREIAYAITSLSPEQADPDTLLALGRDHWHIENRLHWRRDVTLREDIDAAQFLTEIREIFADNRINAIVAAQKGVL